MLKLLELVVDRRDSAVAVHRRHFLAHRHLVAVGAVVDHDAAGADRFDELLAAEHRSLCAHKVVDGILIHLLGAQLEVGKAPQLSEQIDQDKRRKSQRDQPCVFELFF